MKSSIALLLLSAGSIVLSACSSTSDITSIKDNHFRVLNHYKHSASMTERIDIACFRQKPLTKPAKRQYEAGEHSLLVRAAMTKGGNAKLTQVTYANLKGHFQAGKNYQLKYLIKDDKIALWAEDQDTHEKVTKVSLTKLVPPFNFDSRQIKGMCKSSSV